MPLKKIMLGLAVLILIAASFSGGYLFGHRNLVLDEGIIPKLVNKDLRKPTEVDFSLFWEAWDLLHQKYIGSLDPRQLLFGAIRGMVAGVGDPYTVFLPPDESESFLDDLSGRFDGIGAEIAIREDRLIIVSPLEGSPAERAGLKPKDWILAIDGESTETMPLGEATQKIRGAAGTSVMLTILSENTREPREVTVTRQTIQVESVQLSFREISGGQVAVVKIVQFGPETADLLSRLADQILARRPKGILLDVRNNPGGFLDAAIDIASLFVKEDLILKEKNKEGEEKSISRTVPAKLGDLPLVVLINGGSASASEILAGAIQDYRRGKLIGEKTFGKGSVQDLERLKDGSSVRITVAKWFTPKGRAFDGEGLTPDIEVVRTDEDFNADRDPQMDRALAEIGL